jgi:hypothetical protein
MKKVKDYIKKNPEPAKGRFGVNPFDPWSVKYNVAEDSDTGKSVGDSRSSVTDSPTLQKSNEIVKKLQAQKIPNPPGSMHKTQNKPESNQNTSLTPEEVQMKKTTMDRIQEARKTAKEKFAKAAYERSQEHKKFMDSIKDKPHGEQMRAMMDKIRANLNKEEVEQIEEDEMDKDIIKHATSGMNPQKIAKKLNIPTEWVHQTMKYHMPKPERDISDPRNDRTPKSGWNNEEVEQIDELNYDTVKSLYQKRRADFHGAQVGKKKKGKDVSAKNVSTSISRLMGNKPTQNSPVQEETYADAKAADPSVMSPGEGIAEKMTTVQRVKSIHKKLKEEMYDHEKEDKSVQTYGKKPKLQTTKKEDSFGENKPTAALTMTGGTTMTGSKRDEVEIDPMMKKDRPGQPDVTNKKKDK